MTIQANVYVFFGLIKFTIIRFNYYFFFFLNFVCACVYWKIDLTFVKGIMFLCCVQAYIMVLRNINVRFGVCQCIASPLIILLDNKSFGFKLNMEWKKLIDLNKLIIKMNSFVFLLKFLSALIQFPRLIPS